MKKILALILCTLFLFSLVACNNNSKKDGAAIDTGKISEGMVDKLDEIDKMTH